MELKEYLGKLGLDEESIAYVQNTTNMKNVEQIQKKVEFYKSTFGFSDRELCDAVRILPPMLGYDVFSDSPTSIVNKIEQFKKIFKITQAELSKMVRTSPGLLGLDVNSDSPTSVKGKIEFLKDTFGFSSEQVLKIIKNNPAMLAYSREKMFGRIDFYSNLLGITQEETKKFIKIFPNVVGYDKNSVIEKFDFYCQIFGSKEDAKHIISCSPQLLSYDTTGEGQSSINSKIKYYQSEFGLTEQETLQMIKTFPSILGYDITGKTPTSIKSKMKYLSQFASKEDIVKNPTLLGLPALKIKTRYLILSKAFTREEILTNRKLTTNEFKLWARLKFLESRGKNPRMMIRSEDRFSGIGMEDSKTLMGKYLFTEKDLDNLEKEHFTRTNEKIVIDEDERKSIFE